MPDRCGLCVHWNAHSTSCAPRGERAAGATPCTDGYAFPLDQLQAALYGAKASKPAPAPPAPPAQTDLFA